MRSQNSTLWVGNFFFFFKRSELFIIRFKQTRADTCGRIVDKIKYGGDKCFMSSLMFWMFPCVLNIISRCLFRQWCISKLTLFLPWFFFYHDSFSTIILFLPWFLFFHDSFSTLILLISCYWRKLRLIIQKYVWYILHWSLIHW